MLKRSRFNIDVAQYQTRRYGFIADHRKPFETLSMPMFERDEYEAFVRVYYPKVVKLFGKNGLDKPDALDLAQNVFESHTEKMTTWSRHEHDKEEAVRYLFGIARNQLIHWWKSRYKEPSTVSVDPDEDEKLQRSKDILFDFHLKKFARHAKREELFSAIETLPFVHKEVVCLSFFQGLKNREICEIFNWRSESNVTRILKQAYEELRALLA